MTNQVVSQIGSLITWAPSGPLENQTEEERDGWRRIEEGGQRTFRSGGRGGERKVNLEGVVVELSDNPETVLSSFSSKCVYMCGCVCDREWTECDRDISVVSCWSGRQTHTFCQCEFGESPLFQTQDTGQHPHLWSK